MKNLVILTDSDGVLTDWEYAFDVWMKEHGFQRKEGSEFEYNIGKRYGIDYEQGKKLIKIFNESAAIGFLPALRDAMFYVKRLHEEHGYIFHCITSLSLDSNAGKLRRMNLQKLFGKTAFAKFVILDTGADKDKVLADYKDTECWWIEDKITNAEVGSKLGLRSLLMEHGHNMHYNNPNIPRVKNWRQVYEKILAERF